MDSTFWGCDPIQLDEHADRLLDGAQRIQELVVLLRAGSDGARWDGPDGEAHREDTRSAMHALDLLGEDLLGIMRMIREDAAAQERTSSPDETGLWQIRAGLFDVAKDIGTGAHGLAEDVRKTARTLGVAARGWEPPAGWNAPIGSPTGPIRLPGGTGAAPTGPVEGPLPEDSTELNPRLVDAVSGLRSFALSKIPVVGPALGVVQGSIAIHEGVGKGLDGTEALLENTGLGAFTPAVDAARVPWEASGVVLGQDGAINQSLEGLDRLVANRIQTPVDVVAAVAEGDLDGAVAAGEKGLYREIDAGTDFLVPDSISPWLGGSADTAGAAADSLEPFAPELAAELHETQSTLEGWEHGVQQARDDLTDAQTLYDARRRHVPLPHDG